MGTVTTVDTFSPVIKNAATNKPSAQILILLTTSHTLS